LRDFRRLKSFLGTPHKPAHKPVDTSRRWDYASTHIMFAASIL